MTVATGTREAPIVLDDGDDDIVLIAGPLKLPPEPPGPNRKPIPDSFTSTPTTIVLNDKDDSVTIVDDEQHSISEPLARAADAASPMIIDEELLNCSPRLEADSLVSSRSLKRKHSSEDVERQVLPRLQPQPPSCAIPTDSDPFAGLTKNQRKKLRKRLRTEAGATTGVALPELTQATPPSIPTPLGPATLSGPTTHPPVSHPLPLPQLPDKPITTSLPPRNAGPDRATYTGPRWPAHIRKGSKDLIPGPGLGPLSCGNPTPTIHPQPTNLRHPLPPKPGSGMPPNVFGPPTRIIGSCATSEPGCGTFPISKDKVVTPDPSRILVLEMIPKRLRTLDFMLQWCRDISLEQDPAPLLVDVVRKLGKVLVEFETPGQAQRAFNSPRLANEDGRTQIRAFWFRSEDTALDALSVPATTPAQSSSALPAPPVAPAQFEQNPSPILSKVSPASPGFNGRQTDGVFSFTPYSRPIHFPFASTPELKVPSSSDSNLQRRIASQPISLEEGEWKGDSDSEREEGQIEEIMKRDNRPESSNGKADSMPHPSPPENVATDKLKCGTQEPSSSPASQTITAPRGDREVQESQQVTLSTPGSEDCDALIISSMPTPPPPSRAVIVHLHDDDDDELFDREESPQLMYPFPEETQSSASVTDTIAAIAEYTILSSASHSLDGDDTAYADFLDTHVDGSSAVTSSQDPSSVLPISIRRREQSGESGHRFEEPSLKKRRGSSTEASKESHTEVHQVHMGRNKSFPDPISEATEAMDVDIPSAGLPSVRILEHPSQSVFASSSVPQQDVMILEEAKVSPEPGMFENLAHPKNNNKELSEQNKNSQGNDYEELARQPEAECLSALISPGNGLPHHSRMAKGSAVMKDVSGRTEEYNNTESQLSDTGHPRTSRTCPAACAIVETPGKLLAPAALLPQNASEQRLAELRERVLASKRQKIRISEPVDPSFADAAFTVITSDRHSSEGDHEDSSAGFSSSCASVDSSASSAESLFSSESTSSSVTSNENGALTKSASYFDNIAIDFLEGILGPLRSGTSPNSDTDSIESPLNRAPKDPKVSLQNKQRRLEEHLTKSKALLARWDEAKDKKEKARIMALIKEEERNFEADKAATDAELKRLEAAGTGFIRTKMKVVTKTSVFKRWPQTRTDQFVIAVSDSEDDEYATEVDE